MRWAPASAEGRVERSAAIAAWTAGCVAAFAVNWQSPVRTVLGVGFILFGPGMAVVENLRCRRIAEALALAPPVSLALATIVGTILVYAEAYTPGRALYVLAGATVALLATSLLRRRRHVGAGLRSEGTA